MILFYSLAFVGLFTLFISIIVGFLYSYKRKGWVKYFPLFLSVVLIVELYGSYMSLHRINNMFLYNLECCFEFSFYMSFLYSLIRNFRKTVLIPLVIISFIGFSIIDNLFIQDPLKFNTRVFNTGCVFTIILCLTYFIYLIYRPRTILLTREPSFWIVTGIVFYHSMMLPLYGFINHFINVQYKSVEIVYTTVHLVDIIFYILLIVAFTSKFQMKAL
jgi:hypothetical protein